MCAKKNQKSFPTKLAMSKHKVKIAERRAAVWAAKKADPDVNLRTLAKQFNVHHTTIKTDIDAGMHVLQETTTRSAEGWRELVVANALWRQAEAKLAWEKSVSDGEPDVTFLSEHRQNDDVLRKLKGLDAPVKRSIDGHIEVEHDLRQSEPDDEPSDAELLRLIRGPDVIEVDSSPAGGGPVLPPQESPPEPN